MTLRLVRHGRVVDHLLDGSQDPSLSEEGRRQAETLAGRLRPAWLGSSPYRRALETAGPIAATARVPVEVIPEVGEVVPREYDPAQRGRFLGQLLGGVWSRQEDWLQAWRADVIAALVRAAARSPDVVVVTHFVAINVAIGAATASDAVTVTHVENCSVTTFDVLGGRLALRSRDV